MSGPRPRHYLCVFRADAAVTSDVVDAGLDPDFSEPVATGGICRPQTRRDVVPGSCVVFLGYYPASGDYLLKGWLRVGEKLTYLEALRRFPQRRNVIIRDAHPTSLPLLARSWKRPGLRQETVRLYGTDAPPFLTTLHAGEREFVQSPVDDHEIDNWKCQRIFICREVQLRQCIASAQCLREAVFPQLRGYIVADGNGWRDVGPWRLAWSTVAPASLQGRTLRTPLGQHNALRLSDEDVEGIEQTTDAVCGVSARFHVDGRQRGR